MSLPVCSLHPGGKGGGKFGIRGGAAGGGPGGKPYPGYAGCIGVDLGGIPGGAL